MYMYVVTILLPISIRWLSDREYDVMHVAEAHFIYNVHTAHMNIHVSTCT